MTPGPDPAATAIPVAPDHAGAIVRASEHVAALDAAVARRSVTHHQRRPPPRPGPGHRLRRPGRGRPAAAPAGDASGIPHPGSSGQENQS